MACSRTIAPLQLSLRMLFVIITICGLLSFVLRPRGEAYNGFTSRLDVGVGTFDGPGVKLDAAFQLVEESCAAVGMRRGLYIIRVVEDRSNPDPLFTVFAKSRYGKESSQGGIALGNGKTSGWTIELAPGKRCDLFVALDAGREDDKLHWINCRLCYDESVSDRDLAMVSNFEDKLIAEMRQRFESHNVEFDFQWSMRHEKDEPEAIAPMK